jgi:hypothetical protein
MFTRPDRKCDHEDGQVNGKAGIDREEEKK